MSIEFGGGSGSGEGGGGAAFSGARRTIGTGPVNENWSSNTDVSTYFDTEDFDIGSWWDDTNKRYVVPTGVSYVVIGGSVVGSQITRAYVQRRNSSNTLLDEFFLGRDDEAEGGTQAYAGARLQSVSTGDRFKIYVRSFNTTGSSLNGDDLPGAPGRSDFWIEKRG